MAFFRQKTIKGKQYLFIVKSYRENGKIKQEQKYIGRDEKISADIKKSNQELRMLNPKHHGQDIIRAEFEEMSLTKYGTKDRWRDFRNARQLVMTQNMTWIDANIPREMIVEGRIKKSSPPGTLNPTALYQLCLIKDENERLKLYKLYTEKNMKYAWQIEAIRKLN
jgi:hypothetical protein